MTCGKKDYLSIHHVTSQQLGVYQERCIKRGVYREAHQEGCIKRGVHV